MRTVSSRILARLPLAWRLKDAARTAELAAIYFSRRTLDSLRSVATHRDYSRFIILTAARSGSNYLRGLLNTHPEVLCFTELFRNTSSLQWGIDGFPDNWPPAMRCMAKEPRRFLEQWVFRAYPTGVNAVGFKLFYSQGRAASHAQLWSLLNADPDLRIIHLKRANSIRALLSFQRAQRSGIWKVEGNPQQPASQAHVAPLSEPIHINPAWCLAQLEEMEQAEDRALRDLRSRPILSVIYEDLLRNRDQELHRCADFLGVDGRVKLHPVTKKQSHLPLEREIANYAELKCFFANTRWSDCFL